MSTRMASDEVTDGIAAIEMHRQGTEQESGLAASCTEALRKLHALLEQEKEALRTHGPDTIYAINVEAVANEIKRVQAMTSTRGQGGGQRNARGRGPQHPRPQKAQNAQNAPRKRGRRNNMGRGRGGRGGGQGGAGGAGPGPGVR